MKACEKNQPVHELLYLYFHFGTFYIKLRQNIWRGYTSGLTHAWLYCWPLFHATKKNLYTRFSLLAVYIANFGHLIICEALDRRLANLREIPGHCIGTDMVTEKVWTWTYNNHWSNIDTKLSIQLSHDKFTRFHVRSHGIRSNCHGIVIVFEILTFFPF